ncbi:hypothetical protein ABTZ03_42595 [Kitasatospora sp. NPDC096077]|uniref:hypothetical protein n=1 Tax=Kitasatospora sp. NPDC096077 TaxID=3155544 RepID=UPI0033303317
MSTRRTSRRRRRPAPRTDRATRRYTAPLRPRRPAWRDPGRMSGSMLSNTCAGMFLFLLTYLAQHVEVLWR